MRSFLRLVLLATGYVSCGNAFAFTAPNCRICQTTSSVSSINSSFNGNNINSRSSRSIRRRRRRRRDASYLRSMTKTNANEKVMEDAETVGSKDGIILSTDVDIDIESESNSLNNGNNNDNDNGKDSMDISEFLPTLGLLWVVALLSALDRVAMSVAILPLSTEYHLTDTMKGQISSIFSVGYGLAILPCGLLAASVSPRLIMGIGVALWSLATFGTPIAASLIQLNEINASIDATATTTTALDMTSSVNTEAATVATTIFIAANVVPLLFTRAVMGAAESVVLPATQRLLANWVPSSMKSIAVATVISGFQFGTVTAYLLSPWVMDHYGGWRGLFFVYGVVGVLWLVPWTLFSRDYPKVALVDSAVECQVDVDVDVDGGNGIRGAGGSAVLVNTMTDDDASLVIEGRCLDKDGNSLIVTDLNDEQELNSNWDQAVELVKDAPWGSFAKSQAVWAMIIAHAANNWGLYNMLSWTPTFYAEQYGLNVKESAFLSVFPSIAGAICGLSAGFFADKIISSFQSSEGSENDETIIRTNVRKAFQGLALLGPAACLIALSSNIPEDPSTAQALLMGTVGLQAFNAAGYGSSPQEKAGEKWSGLLYSITTLPGVIFGSLGVYVTGQILDMSGQDWSQVFSLNAGIDIVGALAFIALYNSKKEFD